jgi:hypothetical protein
MIITRSLIADLFSSQLKNSRHKVSNTAVITIPAAKTPRPVVSAPKVT